MPVYQYEGVHYSLPDGLSDEEAIGKIKAHLGKGGESPSGPSALDKIKGENYFKEHNASELPLFFD